MLIEIQFDEENLAATCAASRLEDELLIRRVQGVVTSAARARSLDRLTYEVVHRPVHAMFLTGRGEYVDGNLVLARGGLNLVQVGALATEEVRPIRRVWSECDPDDDGYEDDREYVVVCTLLTCLPVPQ